MDSAYDQQPPMPGTLLGSQQCPRTQCSHPRPRSIGQLQCFNVDSSNDHLPHVDHQPHYSLIPGPFLGRSGGVDSANTDDRRPQARAQRNVSDIPHHPQGAGIKRHQDDYAEMVQGVSAPQVLRPEQQRRQHAVEHGRDLASDQHVSEWTFNHAPILPRPQHDIHGPKPLCPTLGVQGWTGDHVPAIGRPQHDLEGWPGDHGLKPLRPTLGVQGWPVLPVPVLTHPQCVVFGDAVYPIAHYVPRHARFDYVHQPPLPPHIQGGATVYAPHLIVSEGRGFNAGFQATQLPLQGALVSAVGEIKIQSD